MQKERAERALERGLPVPTPLPKRAPVTPGSTSRPNVTSSDRGRLPAASAASLRQRIPLSVKLLGLGLGLLGLVYGLTVFRDQKPSPQPAASPASLPAAVK